MTREEALKKQTDLAQHYKLQWWYGTDCKLCCGVYPRYVTGGDGSRWYECDVCGKRTAPKPFRTAARVAWNNEEFEQDQIRFC